MDASTDVGLGTAYERVAIYRVLDAWLARRDVETAFEGPVDNMAGVPGIHLLGRARAGTRVTVALEEQRWLDTVKAFYRGQGCESRLETRKMAPFDALPEKAFDLALTYNALPIVREWEKLLAHVASTSKRWLVVALTNPATYGAWVRRSIRPVERERTEELFDHPSTHPRVIEPMLRGMGTIVEHEYFDCPWWPDLFVDAGESLLGATLKRLPVIGPRLKKDGDQAVSKGAVPLAPSKFVYGPERFPSLDGSEELGKALKKHPVFDHTPLAPAFAHLHAYLVELRR